MTALFSKFSFFRTVDFGNLVREFPAPNVWAKKKFLCLLLWGFFCCFFFLIWSQETPPPLFSFYHWLFWEPTDFFDSPLNKQKKQNTCEENESFESDSCEDAGDKGSSFIPTWVLPPAQKKENKSYRCTEISHPRDRYLFTKYFFSHQVQHWITETLCWFPGENQRNVLVFRSPHFVFLQNLQNLQSSPLSLPSLRSFKAAAVKSSPSAAFHWEEEHGINV